MGIGAAGRGGVPRAEPAGEWEGRVMSATIEYRRSAASYRRLHAVPAGEPAAVCGERPRHGFARPEPGPPDCPACRRKLGMGSAPAPRAEGGAR